MSEMIERVAHAIAKAESGIMFGADRNIMTVDPRALAKAAIEAMREPTDTMIDSVDLQFPAKGMIKLVWQDMIDGALGI